MTTEATDNSCVSQRKIQNTPSDPDPTSPCGVCCSIKSKSNDDIQWSNDEMTATELSNYLVHGFIRNNDKRGIMISVIICIIEQYFFRNRWLNMIYCDGCNLCVHPSCYDMHKSLVFLRRTCILRQICIIIINSF